MKILITGGHMTPALAVIQKLPKDVNVVYIGRKFALEGDTAISLEYRTITKLGIPFVTFQPGRFQRKFTHHTLPALSRIPKGVWEAFGILRQEKPDIILSFGGHVAFPICIAGSFLRIPIVTHEQTLEAGGANRLIAKFATRICVSFLSSMNFFPKEKVVLTGNPIFSSEPSHEIQELIKRIPKKYPVVTITGGSLGSHAINTLVEPILEKLLAKYVVIHQTGDAKEFGDFTKLTDFHSSLPYTFQERYILKKFIQPHDIAYVYESSDLVVCRSGINTVLMLLLVNTPALLIPLPFSQRNEQQKNALFFQNAGLGEVLAQDQIISENLLLKIEEMMESKNMYINRERKAMQQLHTQAAENIIKVVYGAKKDFLQKEI